jgi:two-component system, cell cycle sensor histidine kinase and response regulator CckA
MAADHTAIFAAILDDLPVGVWVARAPNGEFIYANGEFASIMGMGARDDVSRGEYAQPYGIYDTSGALYPESRMPFVRALEARTVITADDIVIHRHDGQRVNVRAFARPVFDAAGAHITHVVIAFFDITAQKQAEARQKETETRLARAQRMEAIGTLAGGIAHDFNNLLTVVQSISSSLQAGERDPERRDALKMIQEVGDRAMQLTRGLLGFAGRGKNFSTAIPLHDMVHELATLVRRTLDPRIEVVLELSAREGHVAGDLSQLEQVFMNLAVNARDAMPDGGRLTARTRDVERDGKAWVVLEIEDSGSGIDPAIRERIFEPYFTTKADGKPGGSGLGLATAWGIVEAHGGTIEAIDARPRGTIMRVLLPATEQRPRSAGGDATGAKPGAGTVLLVEDERLVRAATFRSLKQLGYQCVAVCDGDEAVEVYRARHDEITAVILDMLMPNMSGLETYLALREIDPAVQVLLTTGFTDNEEVQRILDLGVREFIPKPYNVAQLSRALEKVIGPAAR